MPIKHYRIRIVSCTVNRGMWYWDKINTEWDCKLGVTSSGIAVFIVGGVKNVYPVDCIILNEWIN